VSRILAFLILFTLGAIAPSYLLILSERLGLASSLLAGKGGLWSSVFLVAAALGMWIAKRTSANADRPLSSFAKLALLLSITATVILLALGRYGEPGSTWLASGLDEESIERALMFSTAGLAAGLPGTMAGLTLPFAIQGTIRSLSSLAASTALVYLAGTAGITIGLRWPQSFALAALLTSVTALITWLMARQEPVILFGSSTDHDVAARGFSRFILPPRQIRRLAAITGLVSAATMVVLLFWFPEQQLRVLGYAALGLLIAIAADNILVRVRSGFLAILVLMLVAGALSISLMPILVNWLQQFGAEYRSSVAAIISIFAVGIAFPFLLRLIEPFARSAGPAVAELMLFHFLGAAVGLLLFKRIVLQLMNVPAALSTLGAVCALAALLTVRSMSAYRNLFAAIALLTLAVAAWRFVHASGI
jgi:hypothetical protein